MAVQVRFHFVSRLTTSVLRRYIGLFLPALGIVIGLSSPTICFSPASAMAFPQEGVKADKMLEQQVIQNYRNGNLLELEKSLKRLAKNIELDQIDAINQKLEKAHVISLDQLFLNVRAPKVAYSRNSAAPASSPVEYQLVLAAFGESCTSQLQEVKETFASFRKQPTSYQEFDQRLAALSSLRSRLHNLELMVQYWDRFRKHGLADYRKLLEELPPEQTFVKVANRDPATFRKAMDSSKTEVVEQELRTRISRLETAADDLEIEGDSNENRIEAAMVVAVDGQLVPRLLTDYRPFLNHADLKDPELTKEIRSLISEVKKRHGRLIEIGGRLNVGLTYWLQGRFGYASDFGGLLKLPFTLTDGAAQGEVYLPNAPLGVRSRDDSTQARIKPSIERRHFYVSGFPYRRFDCKPMVASVPNVTGYRRTNPDYQKEKRPKDTGPKGYSKAPGKKYNSGPGGSYAKKPSKKYTIGPGPSYVIAPINPCTGGAGGGYFGGVGGGYYISPGPPYYIPPGAPYYIPPKGGPNTPYGIPQSPYQLPPGKPYVKTPSPPKINSPGDGGAKKNTPVSSPGDRNRSPAAIPVVPIGCVIKLVDPNILYRTVGFYEYRHALAQLDEVIRKTSLQEQVAIDNILKQRTGFKIRLLAGEVAGQRIQVEHIGLRWVTALARVELGAMLAALTNVPAPFAEFAPQEFDREAYQALMLEGWTVHQSYMKTDPFLFPTPRTTNGYQVLIQDQHLDLLMDWSQMMVRLSGPQTVQGQKWIRQARQITELREELSGEFDERVSKRTGVVTAVLEDQSK